MDDTGRRIFESEVVGDEPGIKESIEELKKKIEEVLNIVVKSTLAMFVLYLSYI